MKISTRDTLIELDHDYNARVALLAADTAREEGFAIPAEPVLTIDLDSDGDVYAIGFHQEDWDYPAAPSDLDCGLCEDGRPALQFGVSWSLYDHHEPWALCDNHYETDGDGNIVGVTFRRDDSEDVFFAGLADFGSRLANRGIRQINAY